MQETVLATPRMRAIAFSQDDLPALQTLHGDPEVNQYLDGDATVWDPARLAGRLVDYVTSHALQGFGMWKVLAQDGTFIGRAGFQPFEETSEIEMEIVIARQHWGKGYARELAPSLIRWFFDNTYYSHLISFARSDHARARWVLQMAGMSFRERRRIRDMPHDIYQVLSPAVGRLVANG